MYANTMHHSLANGEPHGVNVPSFFNMTAPRRSSLWMQLRILSDRTFKNLYRNPYLMLTHYCISVFLAGRFTIASTNTPTHPNA
jgi:hypothetical protein